jgi:hypothetical protein
MGGAFLQVATFGTDPDELKAAAGAMKPDPDLEVGAPRGGQATGPARKPAWFSLRSTNLPSSRASRSIAARSRVTAPFLHPHEPVEAPVAEHRLGAVGQGRLALGHDPGPGRGILLRLHRVATDDVPPPVDSDLLHLEVLGDGPVAPGPSQDLLTDLLLLPEVASHDESRRAWRGAPPAAPASER